MSYICLMANENGAVVGGDSRETFHPKVHLDWRRKCFALPEKQMVWAACGPTLRLGVDLLRSVERIFWEENGMEEKLEKVKCLVNTVTNLSHWAGDPGSFCLLIAGMEKGRLTVWNCAVYHGELRAEKAVPAPGQPVFFQAGAWCRAMPPMETAGLEGLSYAQLRDNAKARTELAIRLDETRRVKDPDHNQTIGGSVRLAGLKIKHTEKG